MTVSTQPTYISSPVWCIVLTVFLLYDLNSLKQSSHFSRDAYTLILIWENWISSSSSRQFENEAGDGVLTSFPGSLSLWWKNLDTRLEMCVAKWHKRHCDWSKVFYIIGFFTGPFYRIILSYFQWLIVFILELSKHSGVGKSEMQQNNGIYPSSLYSDLY